MRIRTTAKAISIWNLWTGRVWLGWRRSEIRSVDFTRDLIATKEEPVTSHCICSYRHDSWRRSAAKISLSLCVCLSSSIFWAVSAFTVFLLWGFALKNRVIPHADCESVRRDRFVGHVRPCTGLISAPYDSTDDSAQQSSKIETFSTEQGYDTMNDGSYTIDTRATKKEMYNGRRDLSFFSLVFLRGKRSWSRVKYGWTIYHDSSSCGIPSRRLVLCSSNVRRQHDSVR